nr:uncharacterized protein LOC126537786 [Dermacentor andersoni]
MDFVKSYYQTTVKPVDIPETAIAPPFELFERVRMLFRLSNAAQTFQRFINHVSRRRSFLFAYLDDLLGASISPEQLNNLLRCYFRISRNMAFSSIPQIAFGVHKIEFLRHHVIAEGIGS